MKKLILITLAILLSWNNYVFADNTDEMLATFINLKGYLCAKVISVKPLSMEKTYEVRCIEYRGGNGTVDYLVNVKNGTVVKR